jgi:hypothetical protein
MQNKMFATVQDIQKKVDEIYGDWKSTGFGGHVDKNDMKWIDVSIILIDICLFPMLYSKVTYNIILQDAISKAVYNKIEKRKYPNDEQLMQVCYDALVNANKEEFQNKIRNGGWKRFFNKHIRSLVSKTVITRISTYVLNYFTYYLLFFGRPNDFHVKREVILCSVLKMLFMANLLI